MYYDDPDNKLYKFLENSKHEIDNFVNNLMNNQIKIDEYRRKYIDSSIFTKGKMHHQLNSFMVNHNIEYFKISNDGFERNDGYVVFNHIVNMSNYDQSNNTQIDFGNFIKLNINLINQIRIKKDQSIHLNKIRLDENLFKTIRKFLAINSFVIDSGFKNILETLINNKTTSISENKLLIEFLYKLKNKLLSMSIDDSNINNMKIYIYYPKYILPWYSVIDNFVLIAVSNLYGAYLEDGAFNDMTIDTNFTRQDFGGSTVGYRCDTPIYDFYAITNLNEESNIEFHSLYLDTNNFLHIERPKIIRNADRSDDNYFKELADTKIYPEIKRRLSRQIKINLELTLNFLKDNNFNIDEKVEKEFNVKPSFYTPLVQPEHRIVSRLNRIGAYLVEYTYYKLISALDPLDQLTQYKLYKIQ